MNKKEMLACLDNMQQQIDQLRALVLGTNKTDLRETFPTEEKESTIKSPPEKIEGMEENVFSLSREEQMRTKIASLLSLAGSEQPEEEIFEGLRGVIHSETASSDAALGRLQRFNFSRLKQQYSQYLQDGNDFDSFLIEREEKRGFSGIVEYKVFVLANGRKPVPLTFRMDPKNESWMIYSFSL